jgi:hypothetical protein
VRDIEGEGVALRIYIGERDRRGGQPLWQALLTLLRERGMSGCSVFRGLAGFGANAVVHTEQVLRLSIDLPIVIECVDTKAHIEAVLPAVDAMLDGGLVTLVPVRVITHRPHDAARTAGAAPEE